MDTKSGIKTCIIVRGLFDKWSQLVYYDFDTPVTKDIFLKVLDELYKAGFTVVAVVSDLGPSNRKLWNTDFKTGIDEGQKTHFKHPSNANLHVYVFVDVPHLIKLARNHFLDSGFQYNDDLITADCLRELLRLTSEHDLKIAHGLTESHLNVEGTDRQKVKLATQLFSHKNAQAVKLCGKKGFKGFEKWFLTWMVLSLFNIWFDVANSTAKFGNYLEANAFGETNALNKQIQTLNLMNNFISVTRVKGHTTLLPFQKGIILYNKSLIGLFSYLKQYKFIDFNFEYILTNRLNQDVLENFFSYIRGMGGRNETPTALDIQNRLRWYTLGKHSAEFLSKSSNNMNLQNDEGLVTASDVPSSSRKQIYCFNLINVENPENSITLDIKPDDQFMTSSYLTNIFSQKANDIIEAEVETNDQISFSEDVSYFNDTSEIDVYDIQYNNYDNEDIEILHLSDEFSYHIQENGNGMIIDNNKTVQPVKISGGEDSAIDTGLQIKKLTV